MEYVGLIIFTLTFGYATVKTLAEVIDERRNR